MLEKLYEIIKETPINKEALIKLVPILNEVDEFDFYNPAHIYGILDHSIKAAETLADLKLRCVMIFHDTGKIRVAKQVQHKTEPGRFVTKFPNHEIQSVYIFDEIFKNELSEDELNYFKRLIAYHDTPLITGNNDKLMAIFALRYGNEFVKDLLKVQRADMSTHEKKYYEHHIKPQLDAICEIYEITYAKKENNYENRKQQNSHIK